MGIGFSDIIALAKAGYTPADVKELIALSKEAEPKKEEPEKEEPVKEEPEKEEPVKEEPEKKETADQDNVNYKEKFEATQKQLEELQKENASKKIADTSSGEEDSESIFNDAMKNFM